MADGDSTITGGDGNSEPGGDGGWLAKQTSEVQVAIRELRREAAGWRAKHKALEGKLAQLSDAEALAGKLTAAEGQLKDERRYRILTEEAMAKGIRPSLAKSLLDEQGRWADVDVDTDEGREQLRDRLDDLVGELPELKAVAITATRSGGESFNPGPSRQLSAADAARMKPDDVLAAYKRGEFNQTLGRR